VISPARDAALDILLRVQNHGGFASELLHSERLKGLTAQDRGLCTELVLGVLRWRPRLDDALAGVSSQKLSKLDPEVLEALRLAAYQIGFLERIPPHAAVNESVELVKRKKKRSAAPFVNAVLRKLLSKREIVPPSVECPPATPKDLAAHYAHPLWLVQRWVTQYGFKTTADICAHNQTVPTTAVRITSEEVRRALESEQISLEPDRLLRKAWRVTDGDVTKTKVFVQGGIAIQDEASQLVALLVGHGLRLLDCCAAPGGKTAILAERNPEAVVVASEIHQHRADSMASRFRDRPNVRVLIADATSLELPSNFDRVLADVPCSGTGTLARNPEIKWRLNRDDLKDLHDRQVNILRSALAKLVPGGHLVYSTCSLEPEENESVIREVVDASQNYQLLNLEPELLHLHREGELAPLDVQELLDGPFLRVFPGRFGTDGFLAAKITTKAV
jgi:16S rRNA (cytosine967-C5)-methyltransferase